MPPIRLSVAVAAALTFAASHPCQFTFAQGETPASAPAAGAPSSNVADDLPGAAAVIEQVSSKSSPAADGEVDVAKLSAFDQNVRKLKAGDMPAAEAAQAWYDLLDEFLKAGTTDEEKLTKIVAVIPGPDAWPAIAEKIRARPEPEQADAQPRHALLMLIAAHLASDAAAQDQWFQKFATLVSESDDEQIGYLSHLLERIDGVYAGAADADGMIESLARRVARAIEQRSEWERTSEVSVPDLVDLVGRAQADAMLRELLIKPVLFSFPEDSLTLALARELTLELVDQTTVPQWNLVQALDTVELYEAIDEKFSEPDADEQTNVDVDVDVDAAIDIGVDGVIDGAAPDQAAELRRLLSKQRGSAIAMMGNDGDWQVDYAKRSADVYYLLGLVVADRPDDAAAFAKKTWRNMDEDENVYFPYGAITQLEKAGYTEQVYQLMRRLLEEMPDLPVWEQFVSLASRTGHVDEMVALAQKSAAREDMSLSQRVVITRQLSQGQLAAGDLEKGVQSLEQVLTIMGEVEGVSPEMKLGIALQLVRLGAVNEKSKWIDRGQAVAEQAIKGASSEEVQEMSYELPQLSAALHEAGRVGAAHRMLVAQLAVTTGDDEDEDAYYFGGDASSVLTELAGLYHEAGRHDDVLTLLNEAPWWGAADLVSLIDEESTVAGVSMGAIAAAALHADGQDEKAYDVLVPTLHNDISDDAAYGVLLALDMPDRSRTLLEDLARRDRFEERPIIWQAELARRQGDLDEALTLAQQAIKLDPSDGDMGHDDRMRAYAVLADIHEAKGNAEQADFFHRVVRAIRMAERADRMWSAGMLSDAIALYQESLLTFADAYCIQSRLAVQLAGQGKMEEAAEHYRKAFELMPDSFGRMESHCFGCEGVFSNSVAKSIAEQVFTQMVRTSPEKPQVHYLLGYLRVSQNRPQEALASFERAVELDPDYINAWEKIVSVSDDADVSAELRDKASLNLLRLDPMQLHTRAQVSAVRDWKLLWQTVASIEFEPYDMPDSLMKLNASAERVGTDDHSSYRYRRHMMMAGMGEMPEERTPGRMLAEHVVFDLLVQVNGVARQVEVREPGFLDFFF